MLLQKRPWWPSCWPEDLQYHKGNTDTKYKDFVFHNKLVTFITVAKKKFKGLRVVFKLPISLHKFSMLRALWRQKHTISIIYNNNATPNHWFRYRVKQKFMALSTKLTIEIYKWIQNCSVTLTRGTYCSCHLFTLPDYLFLAALFSCHSKTITEYSCHFSDISLTVDMQAFPLKL